MARPTERQILSVSAKIESERQNVIGSVVSHFTEEKDARALSSATRKLFVVAQQIDFLKNYTNFRSSDAFFDNCTNRIPDIGFASARVAEKQIRTLLDASDLVVYPQMTAVYTYEF